MLQPKGIKYSNDEIAGKGSTLAEAFTFLPVSSDIKYDPIIQLLEQKQKL